MDGDMFYCSWRRVLRIVDDYHLLEGSCRLAHPYCTFRQECLGDLAGRNDTYRSSI
jgi:hypothetical protein